MNNQCDGKILDRVDNYSVIECKNCNFRHLLPIPTSNELKRFYEKQYYQDHKPNYIAEDIRDKTYLEITYEERLQIFSKLTQGRNLLDVGCGAGLFMNFSKKKGWNVTGIEPSNLAALEAKELNLEVFEGELEDFVKLNELKFDVIYLKNVLEHVASPEKTLECCKKIMSKEGVLFVEVPNDYQAIQKIAVKILNEPRSWISVPDHINYFNYSSLRKLLVRVGFKPVKRTTTYPIYALLMMGYNFISNKEAGPKAHQKRVNFELFWDKINLRRIKHLIYWFLSALGMGRTVIYYSKREI